MAKITVTKNDPKTKKPDAQAAPQAPQKDTMNLVRHQVSFHLEKFIPILIVLGVVLLVFLKFGIFDPLAGKLSLLSSISAEENKISEMSEQLKEYDELAADYGRYSYGWMNEAETAMVGRLDVMELIEEKVASVAIIENFAVNNNVLSLNVRDITLTQASEIVTSLEDSELVENVSIGRASAESGREAIIYMTVILTKGGE